MDSFPTSIPFGMTTDEWLQQRLDIEGYLVGGVYYITSALTVPSNATIHNCTFMNSGTGPVMYLPSGTTGVRIENCVFESTS